MRNLILFLHLAATIFWMGGMAFMVLALRPSLAQLEPAQRLAVLGGVLRRFFVVVGVSIAVLLASGAHLLVAGGSGAPPGWHAMAALGLLMMLVFAYINFVPYRTFRTALAAADWKSAGAAALRITLLAKVNLGLGWLAIAAVMLWR